MSMPESVRTTKDLAEILASRPGKVEMTEDVNKQCKCAMQQVVILTQRFSAFGSHDLHFCLKNVKIIFGYLEGYACKM